MQSLQKPQSSAKIITQHQRIQETTPRRDFPSISGTRATATTLQTLGLEKAKYVDYYIHEKLSQIVKEHSFNYNGSAHANWSRNLNSLYKKTKIPAAKIKEYIVPLTKHIETIKHWDVKNSLNTFSFLSRIGFFNQLDGLTEHREEVISLRNYLMSDISEKLQEITINQTNAIGFVCLLKSVLDQVNHDKSISSISEELLKQTYSCLMETQEILLSYHYKEILQTLTEIGNRLNKYVPLFKPLIYKHLDCMANIEIKSDNEFNFSAYLLGITNLTALNFPLKGKDKANIIQLISKINFTRDIDMAVFGLKSMTILVDKDKIPLASVEDKINECIHFLQEKNLALYQISFVLLSISKYIQASETFTDNLKKIVEQYLFTLIKHKNALPIETLQVILKMIRTFTHFNYPVASILQQMSEAFDKNKTIFSHASSREIHATITNLTKVLLHTKNEFNVYSSGKFANFLAILMPRYFKIIIDTPLNEKVNSFTTLSDLIDSGYLANLNMKATFNDLFSKIDSEIHLLSTKQRISFLRIICLKYNLFSLDNEKTIEYTNKLLELSASKAKIEELSISEKSTLLWSMLVFYETNHKKFTESLLNKFKEAIISLYVALDKEKENNELISSESIGYILAANWFGYQVESSSAQGMMAFGNKEARTKCLRALQTKFNELHFEEEQSINGLAPCDIVEHDRKLAIELRGMHHFLDKDRTLIDGTTILKNALLRKNDYHVIEIKVIDGKISNSETKACLNKIEEILGKPTALQKVKFI